MRWLNEDAKRWHRLWSMRATIGFGLLTGGVYGIAFFSDGITPFATVLFALNMLGYAAIAVARVYKQPGLE